MTGGLELKRHINFKFETTERNLKQEFLMIFCFLHETTSEKNREAGKSKRRGRMNRRTF